MSPWRQKNKPSQWSLTSLNTENILYGENISELLGYKRPCHLQKMKSGEERNKYTQSTAGRGGCFVISSHDIQIFLFHSAKDYNIWSTGLGENNYSKCIILGAVILWYLTDPAELEWDCTSANVQLYWAFLHLLLLLLIFWLQEAVVDETKTKNPTPQPWRKEHYFNIWICLPEFSWPHGHSLHTLSYTLRMNF